MTEMPEMPDNVYEMFGDDVPSVRVGIDVPLDWLVETYVEARPDVWPEGFDFTGRDFAVDVVIADVDSAPVFKFHWVS